jgi:tetraacyldisaccharide 4'-kinase
MIDNLFLRVLLIPLAILYFLVVWLRNKFFDIKLLSTSKPAIYTICVGNLSAGGTGKTPMVELLVGMFSNKYNTAILSRGYGRKTKGFYQANEKSTSQQIGDEPFQYFLKFANNIQVFVGENRVKATKEIIKIQPKLQLLLLDDAFQHRYISAHFNIVLLDYNNLPEYDYLMPVGTLREPIGGLKRANLIVITKCPTYFNKIEAETIEKKYKKYLDENGGFFFTYIKYGKPIQFSGPIKEIDRKVVLISGIANSKPFLTYCDGQWEVSNHFEYKDHHYYSLEDINQIIEKTSDTQPLLTTEKDYVKLRNRLDAHISAYYLPIETDFLFDQKGIFEGMLLAEIKNFYEK